MILNFDDNILIFIKVFVILKIDMIWVKEFKVITENKFHLIKMKQPLLPSTSFYSINLRKSEYKSCNLVYIEPKIHYQFTQFNKRRY